MNTPSSIIAAVLIPTPRGAARTGLLAIAAGRTVLPAII